MRAADRLAVGWAGHVIGRAGLIAVITVPLRVLIRLVGAAAGLCIRGIRSPAVPLHETVGKRCEATCCRRLAISARPCSRRCPDFLAVALIFAIARLVVRAVHAFFAGVQARRVMVGWVDETTARPTERLATVVVWLFALVAAYPYIPGSDSEAFQGVGVFVGLMLSLGASGIVNQAVSGLMLMYTRSLEGR